MTTQEVATKLDIQNRTVIEYINRGRIKATWVKGTRHVSKAAFARYLRTKKPVGWKPGRPRKKKGVPQPKEK